MGNYRIERLLGRGRMGVVYLAQDEALLRPAAVKIMSWAFAGNQGLNPESWFLSEARNIARVNHPSVIQVFSVAKHLGYCYIAMEYVDGISADRLVEQNGRLSPELATEIVLQIASALDSAHNSGVIHCDVKPANIFIKPDRTAKIGDFGMALHQKTASPNREATRACTPHYAAPEIWRGSPATPSTDIYALGATFYFLLTGHPPYEAHDLNGLIAAHTKSPIPDPSEIVPGIALGCVDILRRCLAKTSDERYDSAQSLAWDLRGVLREMCAARETPAANSTVTPAPTVEPGSPSAPGDSPWYATFGFSQPPFADPTPETCLGFGEPFSSAWKALVEGLEKNPGGTILFRSAAGSGHSALIKRLLTQSPLPGPVACLDGEDGPLRASLIQRACRAFGAVPSSRPGPGGEIEGLLLHFEASLGSNHGPALLILESGALRPEAANDITTLSRVASSTKYFTLILSGRQEQFDNLEKRDISLQGPTSAFFVELPPLTLNGAQDYFQRSLKSGLEPDAPVTIVTPDAVLLLAHRAEGSLIRFNRLAQNMLQLAALTGKRLITSWEAWSAPDGIPDLRAMEGLIQQQPEIWPSPEVQVLLTRCREAAGMPPVLHQEPCTKSPTVAPPPECPPERPSCP